MSELRVGPVDGDVALRDWQHVHNVIIPVDELSLDEVRERVGRYLLEVAYLDDVLVGCTTVRPPAEAGKAATVIVRVLAEHRRRGIGERLYARALGQAKAFGANDIETIVWACNMDGMRFAESHGFGEVSRYEPDEEFPFITLKLA
jgi:GNAT superfamily N-acetyltransferase